MITVSPCEALLSVAVNNLGDIEARLGRHMAAADHLHQALALHRQLGNRTGEAATMDGLASAHGVLQTAVNRELRMKRTPTLDFVYDDTAERADRMERLLAEMEHDA